VLDPASQFSGHVAPDRDHNLVGLNFARTFFGAGPAQEAKLKGFANAVTNRQSTLRKPPGGSDLSPGGSDFPLTYGIQGTDPQAGPATVTPVDKRSYSGKETGVVFVQKHSSIFKRSSPD
jgi:hypothetical protein